MKIMHIVSSAASGGAEIYVKDMSLNMAKKGHEVFVAFIDRAEEAGRDRNFEEKFLKELRDSNIGFDFLGQKTRKNPFQGVARLRRMAREFCPDIVHSHLYYGSVFSWFLPGVRRIYTHHNIRLGAHRFIYKFLDLRFDAYVGICNACTKLLETVSNNRVCHIDNGVDDTRLLKKSDYPKNAPVRLLFVGRLSDQKNLELLIKSASRVKELDFEITIAGEGHLLADLQALSKELGVASKINFIGNSDNVKKLLHEADLFVMSSAWEGLPIAQIEATLTGLPVLVTDVGGCSEIVENVGNGQVVKVDLDDFSASLDNLIKNYSLRKKYHENALNNSDKYTIEMAVHKHIALYEDVL